MQAEFVSDSTRPKKALLFFFMILNLARSSGNTNQLNSSLRERTTFRVANLNCQSPQGLVAVGTAAIRTFSCSKPIWKEPGLQAPWGISSKIQEGGHRLDRGAVHCCL